MSYEPRDAGQVQVPMQPLQQGLQVIGQVDVMKLLKSTYLPEDVKEMLWGLVSQLIPLSNLDNVTYERLYWKTKYIITLAKAWLEYERERLSESNFVDSIMKLEQLEYLVILQLRRSVSGFWSKILTGVYREDSRRPGLLARLFG